MKPSSVLLLILSLTAWRGLSAQNLRPWNEYRTILWMGAEAQKYPDEARLAQRLRELGINTAMVGGGGNPKRFTDAGFGHYVENMISKGLCLKFRSNVTNWSKFVDTWKVDRSEAGLVRDYSFEDPKWRGEALGDMRKLAAHHAPFNPLMYDIRDELSTTISANPFDYDFSPISLAAFREWLKTQYGSLAELNGRWQTHFATWEEVKPFTTDQIKHRMAAGVAMPAGPVDWQAVKATKFDRLTAHREPTRWNFSPWADHRTYMDTVLAKTLGDLRTAAHDGDPVTPVGIEGTQMPHAFGGYDLWRLSQVLDWVEPYDVCNSREILGSFMPGKPLLATVFEKDTQAAQRRLWHLLLEGDKGCIIWWSEDVIDWKKPELPLTDKGRALAPVMKSLTSPLARLFMRAERERDPIGIHYSHASIQVAWLLESIADGPTWLRRFSSYEADHNQHAMVRNDWVKALQDLGFSPVFVSSEQIEKGQTEKLKALVMPQSWAVSDAEGEALEAFAGKAGRLIFADADLGMFDGRGRLRAERMPAARSIDVGLERHAVERLKDSMDLKSLMTLNQALADQGVVPPVQVPPEACVRVHRLKVADVRLIAFERNVEYKMREELAQAGGNEALEKAVTFKAKLQKPGVVVNLKTGERLGKTNEIAVKLDPWMPALFAVAEDENALDQLLRSIGGE